MNYFAFGMCVCCVLFQQLATFFSLSRYDCMFGLCAPALFAFTSLISIRYVFPLFAALVFSFALEIFNPDAFTYWFPHLFISIRILLCTQLFANARFVSYQFTYFSIGLALCAFVGLYLYTKKKQHQICGSTSSRHMYGINSRKPVTNLLFSLIYYAEQIVYGHFGWLKMRCHTSLRARSATIKFRVCAIRKFIT